ncbi:hypothetical protein GUJ93_ZPchr0013g37655 [Zizania palustris]|uniref:Uncharacterized protein n=1 Tax=Zizania palustris TaxID=103762 RepID=A0A8J6C3P5_ZIZPA|nr:hypothetical protein GUJ93_ZPchr0013g37655 [Zizania palustris]
MAAFASASPSPPVISVSPWRMSSLRAALPSIRPTPAGRLQSSFAPAAASVGCFGSFSGLAPLSHLLSLGEGNSSVEHRLFGIDVRGRVLAMRHGRRVPKLNRPPDQRKALLRGLTTQLLKHGRIKTTRPRAKAMRKLQTGTGKEREATQGSSQHFQDGETMHLWLTLSLSRMWFIRPCYWSTGVVKQFPFEYLFYIFSCVTKGRSCVKF